MSHREPVCFTCGEAVSAAPLANRIEDGTACPACRDRFLDEMPSLLPRLSQEGETGELLGPTLSDPEESEVASYVRPRLIGLRADPTDLDGPVGA